MNLVLAVSPSIGVAAYWAFVGSMNESVFSIFLAFFVFPALVDSGPKYLMWDNLSSHLTATVRGVVAQSGHRSIFRPTHSPDFAPVEFCFSEIDNILRGQEGNHDPESFAVGVGNAASMLSKDHIRAYFARCHYYIPELPFRPYEGQQV